MFSQSGRLKEFTTKALKEEYNKAIDNNNYDTLQFMETPRDITLNNPWQNIYVNKHNLKPYERIQEGRPFNRFNNSTQPLNMYDDKSGIYTSEVPFIRGIYPMNTFKPKPHITFNM